MLSGYTVAVVAVLQIDSPGQVFESGLNRGAAITIGILALALANDLFAAPDTHPGVAGKIDALGRTVREATLARLRGPGATGDTAAALLFRKIMALHADIAALSSESLAGRARAAAARSAVAALVGEVQARAPSRPQAAPRAAPWGCGWRRRSKEGRPRSCASFAATSTL